MSFISTIKLEGAYKNGVGLVSRPIAYHDQCRGSQLAETVKRGKVKSEWVTIS